MSTILDDSQIRELGKRRRCSMPISPLDTLGTETYRDRENKPIFRKGLGYGPNPEGVGFAQASPVYRRRSIVEIRNGKSKLLVALSVC